MNLPHHTPPIERRLPSAIQPASATSQRDEAQVPTLARQIGVTPSQGCDYCYGLPGLAQQMCFASC
jgi:hypothetical protein